HHDPLTGRDVAKAVLRDPSSPQMRKRFLREARILAQLEHPNIVPLHSIEADGENGPSFTMKLVQGQAMNRAIREGALTEVDKIEIFAKVCEAVSFAHSEGVLHLDLKPENIQLGEFGEVLVCDWGLAGFLTGDDAEFERFYEKDSDLTDSIETHTRYGEVRGTPGYLAPEQADPKQGVKGRHTDVYSLGAMLYTLVTGKTPLEGEDDVSTLQKTIEGEIPPPSELEPHVSPGLEAICLRAMQVEPGDRYASAEDLLADVQAYRRGFAPQAEQANWLRQGYLLLKRHQRFSVTIAVALAAIVGLSTISLHRLQQREVEVKTSEANALRLLAKVAEQQASLGRIESSLDERLFEVINYHYAKQDYADLGRLIDARLELDPANSQALRRKAMLHLIFQEFDQFLAMEDLPQDSLPGEYEAIDDFLQSRSHPTDPLAPDELARFVDEFSSVNSRLTERVLSWAFAKGLPIEENLDLLTAGLRINNPDLELPRLEWDSESKALSLANSEELEDLGFLHHLPISALDLSGSDIRRIESLPRNEMEQLELRNCRLRLIEGLTDTQVRLLDIRGAEVFTDDLKRLASENRFETLIVEKNQISENSVGSLRRKGVSVQIKEQVSR
ncbi:MAG: serine/threonine-protein kinase, partial [Verrucomicrobiota bacterium]